MPLDPNALLGGDSTAEELLKQLMKQEEERADFGISGSFGEDILQSAIGSDTFGRKSSSEKKGKNKIGLLDVVDLFVSPFEETDIGQNLQKKVDKVKGIGDKFDRIINFFS